MCPDQLVVVFALQLPQTEGISGNLRRRILAAKTWQYLLKYGWCWVRFVFVVISLMNCFLWPSLAIFGRVMSIVVLVYFYRCSFYRCGARNFHRCILPGHIVASLFFVSLPSVATSSFPLCTPRSVFAYQFFFLSSSRFQPEGVLSVLSCCVWQECRSQLLLRCISPRLLSASLPGRGKKFR